MEVFDALQIITTKKVKKKKTIVYIEKFNFVNNVFLDFVEIYCKTMTTIHDQWDNREERNFESDNEVRMEKKVWEKNVW